jgi:excisionase family DNA binding protein
MNWLTTKEACDYLKIGRSTLMDLKNRGMVKTYAIFKGRGRARPILRWLESDLDTLLLGQKRRKMQRTPEAEPMRPEISNGKCLTYNQ